MVQALADWAIPFMLNPDSIGLHQFISYAFLHGSWGHIFGNMLFLYIFGRNVNDRLGHTRYTLFYLAGGIASGIGHVALHQNPVIGASGAVAAITGGYLVLYPKSLIHVVYWFFIIGTLQIPAIWFITFKLIFIDNVLARTGQNIAYDAHLAGYAFGAGILLLFLGTNVLTPSGNDLWTMIRQWNRRRRYRKAVADYDPFTGIGKNSKGPFKTEASQPTKQDKRVHSLRNEIAQRMNQRNIPAAAEAYLDLMAVDNTQLLPRAYLLEIANQLAGQNRYEEAARAYEQFLENYGSYDYADQVELMLGLIYARYMNETQNAKQHLQAAMEKLSDPGQIKLCREELQKLNE